MILYMYAKFSETLSEVTMAHPTATELRSITIQMNRHESAVVSERSEAERTNERRLMHKLKGTGRSMRPVPGSLNINTNFHFPTLRVRRYTSAPRIFRAMLKSTITDFASLKSKGSKLILINLYFSLLIYLFVLFQAQVQV